MNIAPSANPGRRFGRPEGVQIREFMQGLVASAVSNTQKARAEATLSRCIGALEASSWPAVVWQFSGLNGDGCPLEVCFSSLDRELRYTTEVAGPEVAHDARMGIACDLASSSTSRVAEKDVMGWKEIQSTGPLSWGAALSVRHDANGERFKVYLEVPASISQTDKVRMVEHGSLRFHRNCRWVMFGQDMKSGSREFYFRFPPLDRVEAQAVRSALEADEETAPLMEVLASLFVVPIETALQWANLGYSVAISPDGGMRVSFFLRSSATDSERLQAMLRRPTLACGSPTLYSELVPESAAHIPHGVVTLISHPEGTETRVCLSASVLAKYAAVAR